MPPFRLFLRQVHRGRWTGPVGADAFLLAGARRRVGGVERSPLGPTLRTIHSAGRGEQLHVLNAPDLEYVERIGEFRSGFLAS